MTQENMIAKVQEYLSFRRKLGYALKNEGKELLQFAQYADQTGHHGPITTALCVKWAILPKNADSTYRAWRLGIVRRFARHRFLFEPRTEIPPAHLLGAAYRRRPPHIYSDEEIASLLHAAGKLTPVGGLRSRTYVTLFGLLACTGLRISEALRLTREDVDLQTGVLTVKNTKFRKSRLIPVHPSTLKVLREYSQFRDSYHPQASPRAFFLTEMATSLKYHLTIMTFIALRRVLGWSAEDNQRMPRIHDLRHTFAVKRLLRWYEEGENLDQKILALSTYLGHVKITYTYWYLSAVPELLAVVSRRFESFFDKKGDDIS